MGISEILAFLAFGIALIALWLVSDVIKKVESQQEKFIKNQVQRLRADIRELDDKLLKIARVSAINEEHIKEIGALQASDKAAVSEQIVALDKRVRELDQSIPQRYRKPPTQRPPSIQ